MELTVRDLSQVNTKDFDLACGSWNSFLFCLEVNGEIVAISDGGKSLDTEEAETMEVMNIYHFAVKTGENGKGYGTDLVKLLSQKYSINVHDVIESAGSFWNKMSEKFNVSICSYWTEEE